MDLSHETVSKLSSVVGTDIEYGCTDGVILALQGPRSLPNLRALRRWIATMTEKKSERLEVRLGYQEKSDFVEACETQGDTPSSALRRFIRGYVRRADADVLASAWRGAFRKRVAPLALGALGVWAATTITWSGVNHWQSRPLSDDAIFEARDLNGDGILQAVEHGLPNSSDGELHGILKVLDLDASGTISREEFVSSGRMVFALQAENEALPSGDDPRLTFVEFEFRPEEMTFSTFQNSIVNAGNLDRLVLWYADGSNAKFEENVEIRSDGTFVVLSQTATFPASMNVETKEDGTTVASPKP